MRIPDTLIAAFVQNAAEVTGLPALSQRAGGGWRSWTWDQLLFDALDLAAGLEGLGLQRGQRLLLLGDHHADLYIAMLAAAMLGACSQPIDPAQHIENFTKNIPAIAIAEDQTQVLRLLELRTGTGWPATILSADPQGIEAAPAPQLLTVQAVAAQGRARLIADAGLRARLLLRAEAEDPLVLLPQSDNCSGEITHAALLAGAREAERSGHISENEQIFLKLPLTRPEDLLLALGSGILQQATLHLPRNRQSAAEDFRAASPSLHIAPVADWQAMHMAAHERAAAFGPLRRRIMAHKLTQNIDTTTRLSNLVQILTSWLTTRPLRRQLGLARTGRAYSSDGAVPEDAQRLFRALGLPLVSLRVEIAHRSCGQ